MSDVNEIKNDEAELKKAMIFVNSQKPIDHQLEKNFQNVDKKYKAEIKPLEDEFDKKLKEYNALSDEYYNKYVGETTAQNDVRRASWNQQMNRYENYNYAAENQRRNQAFADQNAWRAQSAKLNSDYDSAVTNYQSSVAKWNKTKADRETLLSTISQRVENSRNSLTNYAKTHSTNLDQTLIDEFQRIKSELIDINNGYTKNIAQYIPWLNSQGAGHIKKVAVVGGGAQYAQSGVPYGAFWFGVVGKQNCRRNNIRAPKILVRIGNTNSAAPGSTIRERTRRYWWGGRQKIKEGISHTVSSTPTRKSTYVDPGWQNKVNLNIPIGFVEPGVGITIDNTISPYGNNNRGQGGFIGQTSAGSNVGWPDRFSVSVTGGNTLSINRIDFRLNQWGQDLHLYVRRNDYGLTADTVGNVTKKSVWGSSFKWNNQYGTWKVFQDNDSVTLDNVPKLIWYPNGEWDSPCPVMNQEYSVYYTWDYSKRGTRPYVVFMQVFYVDYTHLERCGESLYMLVSTYCQDTDIYINGLRTTTTPLPTNYYGHVKKLPLKTYIKQGANIIMVRAKGWNGPNALTLALCGSTKPNTVDYGNIFVSTNEDWVVLRSDYKCELTFTDHRGRSTSGFNTLFQDDAWMGRLMQSMKEVGYFKKTDGAQGVKTHNYKPPNAKVKYVRIKFAMRPAEADIQISQLAVYSVDNMNKNVAQGMPVTANSVYPSSNPSPSNAVDGTLSARPFPNIYHSGKGYWNQQFFEITLLNPVTIYKIDFFGRTDCCQDRAKQLHIELFDENRISIFSGPPFGSDAVAQSFYFNNPIVPDNTMPTPVAPRRGTMTTPFPSSYIGGVLPTYPVMPAFNTPDQELLNKLITKSGELITLNLRIQEIYKRYTMDGTITQYQSSVLERRRNLVTQVMGMIQERNTLSSRVSEYVATAKNQLDQEKRAFSSHTYLWIWSVFTCLTIILFIIYNFFPTMMSDTPNIISWAVIILTTILMTMFIGGSITFMLWLITIVSLFFYIIKTRYDGYIG